MNRPASFALAVLAGFACLSANAHHSTKGIYNEDEVVEIAGVVREWRFVNPHPSLIVEVVGPDGAVQLWDISYGGAAVTHLRRRGYTADTFSPGDAIVVRGFAALADTAFGLLIRGDPVKEDGSPVVAAGQ